MLSSRGVRLRAFPVGLFLLALSVAGLGANVLHGEDEESSKALPPITTQATAVVVVDGRDLEVTFASLSEGPLFPLVPVAEAMGAVVTALPGEAYRIDVGNSQAIVGPEGRQLVFDQRIVQLAHQPVRSNAGLLVSLDFFETVFGEAMGCQIRWDGASRQLKASCRDQEEQEVPVDVVHVQGTTTVVLNFPTPGARYRVETAKPDVRSGEVTIQLLAGRFRPRLRGPVGDDPLVEAVEVGPNRVRVSLVAGARSESYEVADPFRLVLDIHAGSPSDVPAPTALAPSSPGGRVIVIDPGHGGVETGALGKGGAVEKELNLLLAQALRSALEARLNARVVMTREADIVVPHANRTAIANQNKATLFLSIHLNSSFGSKATGAETYFLSLTASDRHAAQAAAAENAFAESAGSDGAEEEGQLELILWDLAQSRHLAESQRLATLIQGELNSALGLRDRGVKQAPFAVLNGAAMPAVLIELGFISNPEDEARLKDPAHRARLVEAVARAVVAFFGAGGSPPPTTAASAAAPPEAAPAEESGETEAEPPAPPRQHR